MNQEDKDKVVNIIKKHVGCRGPHKTNGGFVSCLMMVYSEIAEKDPWELVKELGVERRYADIPKYPGGR